MFEEYSDPAQRIIAAAGAEARQLGHAHIGTEHLLLGLLTEVDSPVTQALPSGTTVEVARHKVAEAVGTTGTVAIDGDLSFTPRAKRALERASRFSLQRHDHEVGTIHVLLGVLDVEGRAGQVLRGLGVDVGRLRDATEQTTVAPSRAPLVKQGAGASRAATPEPSAAHASGRDAHDRSEPRCSECGALLDSALACKMLAADDEDGAGRRFLVAYCSVCGASLGATPA